MSMMGFLKQAKARAEQGAEVAESLFNIIDGGVSKLERHHDTVASHFQGVLGFVEEMIQGAEELGGSGASSNVPAGSGSAKHGLQGILDDFSGLDAGKIAAALVSATGVAEDIVTKTVGPYLAEAPKGIAMALAAATQAASDAGASGSLPSDLASAVAKTVAVVKRLSADPDHVAPAVVAHADATDRGGDAEADAKAAASTHGADDDTAQAIASAVSTAP